MELNHNNGMVSGLNGKFAHWLDKETSGEQIKQLDLQRGKGGNVSFLTGERDKETVGCSKFGR